MDIGGEGVGVYAEAKGEYTRQLCQFLVPALQKFYIELVEAAKKAEPDAKKVLLKFQHLLEDISEWNIDKVQRETQQIAMSTQCDYLEELLTAVFIAHTKVLSAIRLTSKQKKLQITIPKLDHFLHKTMVECARLLWSNTYLFSSSGPSIERQKNHRQIEALITDGVLQGIRSMLPVKNILREYLREDVDDKDDEEEAEEEAEEEEKPETETKEEKPEVKPEEKPEEKPEPEPEPEAKPEAKPEGLSVTKLEAEAKSEPEKVEDVSSNVIVIDATTDVQFTGVDTVFDTVTPEDSHLEDKNEIIDEVKFLDAPPEPMDDFDDLTKEESLEMDFDEVIA
jgi:hypothetical protein